MQPSKYTCFFYPTGLIYMNYLLHRKSMSSTRTSRLWYKHRKPYQGETAGCLPNFEMNFLLGMLLLRNISKKVSVCLGGYTSPFRNLNSIYSSRSRHQKMRCQVRAQSLLSRWHHLARFLCEEDGNHLLLPFVLRTHISVMVKPGCPGHF